MNIFFFQVQKTTSKIVENILKMVKNTIKNIVT